MFEIIPIGFDCGTASELRDNGIRNASYPFDWNVTFGGISDIFNNDFQNFLNIENNYNYIYNIFFMHDTFPNDNEKYERRIERLRDILASDKEILFIRKSHSYHNHKEILGRIQDDSINDINDIIKFDNFIKNKYPLLKYKILFIAICSNCYLNTILNNSENIFYINISKKYDNDMNDLIIDFDKFKDIMKNVCISKNLDEFKKLFNNFN